MHALVHLSALGEEELLEKRLSSRGQAGDGSVDSEYLIALETRYKTFFKHFSGPKIKIDVISTSINEMTSIIKNFLNDTSTLKEKF